MGWIKRLNGRKHYSTPQQKRKSFIIFIFGIGLGLIFLQPNPVGPRGVGTPLNAYVYECHQLMHHQTFIERTYTYSQLLKFWSQQTLGLAIFELVKPETVSTTHSLTKSYQWRQWIVGIDKMCTDPDVLKEAAQSMPKTITAPP